MGATEKKLILRTLFQWSQLQKYDVASLERSVEDSDLELDDGDVVTALGHLPIIEVPVSHCSSHSLIYIFR